MRIILFTTFFLISAISFCQNEIGLKSNVTPSYEDNKKTDSLHTMMTIQSGLTGLIRSNKKKIFYDVFNEELLRQNWGEIEFKKKEKIIGELEYDEGIMVFTESHPEKDERILYSHFINLKDNRHETVELSKIKVDKKLSLFSNIKGAAFAKSEDKSKYAVLTYTIHKDKIYYLVSVFNSIDNSIVFEKSIERKENNWLIFSQLIVSNDGIVYSLEETFYNQEEPTKKEADNRKFLVSKYSSNAFEILELENKDHVNATAKVYMNLSKLCLAGLYSIPENPKKILGTSNIIFSNNELIIEKESYVPFPKNIYEDIISERKLNRKDEDDFYLRDYKINQILKDNIGNQYIVAEETYYTDKSLFAAFLIPINSRISYWDFSKIPESKYQKSRDAITPHFDNLLILKYDKNNNLMWGRSVLKNEYKSTYNVFLNDNIIHIILNSGKNLKEYKDGRIKVNKGFFESSSLYDYYFTEKGEDIINKIQDNSGKSYYLPKYGSYTNEKFIMMSDSKRKRNFILLE